METIANLSMMKWLLKTIAAMGGIYFFSKCVEDIFLFSLLAYLLYLAVDFVCGKMRGRMIEETSGSSTKATLFALALFMTALTYFEPVGLAVLAGVLVWLVDPVYVALDKTIDGLSEKLDLHAVPEWVVWSLKVGLVSVVAGLSELLLSDLVHAGLVAGYAYWAIDAVFGRLIGFRKKYYISSSNRFLVIVIGILLVKLAVVDGTIAVMITTAVLCWVADYLPEKLKLRNLFRKK